MVVWCAHLRLGNGGARTGGLPTAPCTPPAQHCLENCCKLLLAFLEMKVGSLSSVAARRFTMSLKLRGGVGGGAS